MTFAVRTASALDYPVFVRLFPELGVSDPLPTEEHFATRMLPRVSVLEEAGVALGYAFHQVYGSTTHVVHVVVDPRARGRRAGAALLEDVRRRARGEGCTRWYLNVKQSNAAAIRLYERCGFTIELEGWATRTTWSALATLPAYAGALDVQVPRPEGDAALAARFDLLPERIAQLRARPGVVLVVLLDGTGDAAAFAALDPSFPGVYPIRMTRADLARPLFDALRPHAHGHVEHVNVFVEGDRQLFEQLRDVGADLQHALYRMGATVG